MTEKKKKYHHMYDKQEKQSQRLQKEKAELESRQEELT